MAISLTIDVELPLLLLILKVNRQSYSIYL